MTQLTKCRLSCLILLSIAPFQLSIQGQGRTTGSDNTATLATKAAEYMKERARVTEFSGVVLVVRDGRTILRRGYGLANREFDIQNSPAMKYRLGSVGKQFTAAAVLLLAQRGKLKTTDRVSQYLADWPKAWDEVTIHHLLTHTAGLPPLTTAALLDVSGLSGRTAPYNFFKSVRDLFKPGEELKPLDFKPGEKWNYSNIGYLALGMIIEKASGENYCDFLANALFKSMGMFNTACEDPTTIVKQRASGYTRVNDGVTNAHYLDMRFASGDGSVYSTLDDLIIWNRALESNRLLDSATTERLFTPVQNSYGYGWWVQTKFDRKVQWHGGNVSGFATQITRYPDEHLFIVVLSNVWSALDRSQVRAISYELAAMAFAKSYELPRKHKEIKIDSAIYDTYVGEYSGKDKFAIVREGERLMFQFPPGQSVFEIVPESPTDFFWRNREYSIKFFKDGQGKVSHAVINYEGEIGRWEKTR